MTLQRFGWTAMGTTANPRDTVVGTVGDCIEVEWDGPRSAVMGFQTITFGDPTEINVEYTWDPEQSDPPRIEAGTVIRVWGWLDDDGSRMEMESWEDTEDRELSALVCGGRKFAGWAAMQTVLDRTSPDGIIHGAAPGADTLAGRYTRENGISCRSFPAHWWEDGRLNKAAGHQRNQQMLDEGKPGLVVAFPGGPGTRNMVKIAREQGFSVQIIDHQGRRQRGNAAVVEG